ncbi:MAG: sensor histidine kinase [Fimbriimonas sp.]
MTQRALPWIIGFCFGGAAILAVFGWAVFFGRFDASPGLVMVAAAIPLALAGLLAQKVGRLTADVLEQRESRHELLQAQLEQQRRAVDELADGLDVAIFICDARAVIAYANRRACELFRLQSSVGRSILAVTLSYELEQLVIESAQSGDERNAELTFVYPDERVGLAKAWCPHPDQNRVFLSVYEITELRRLERVRTDFVANVSHELRTPMTLIRAMAETLLDDMPDDGGQAHRYLTKTIAEVDRLSTITQDLLILSAAESNPVRKQVCDIAEVFRGVTQELSKKAADKGLSVQYVGLPELRIEANPSQMKQVALNLVDNAINYTHAGSIKVDVLREGDDAIVEIRDTGIGIASEYLDRIFERFYRVDKGRSRATGGTGLGLSIVKHIVEAHGGTVTVESRLNQGSTFTVRLPKGEISASDVSDAKD